MLHVLMNEAMPLSTPPVHIAKRLWQNSPDVTAMDIRLDDNLVNEASEKPCCRRWSAFSASLTSKHAATELTADQAQSHGPLERAGTYARNQQILYELDGQVQ
jgi:hypothetical protein